MTLFQKRNDITDDDIKKLLEIFKKLHVNNVWAKVRREDFSAKRFEAGFVNDISYCTLTEEAQKRFSKSGNCSPTGIVVKIFNKESIALGNMVHFAVACSLISSNNLGAKLIYIDDECCVNEYIEGSRHYILDDDNDKEFNKQVMKKLAQYHNLQVPTSTNLRQWLANFEILLQEFPGAQDIWSGKYLEYLDANPELKSFRKHFETMDFKILQYFTKAMHEVESPIVFTHMDFHRLNRLVKEQTLPSGEKTKELFFVDLDASLYAYRGHDLSTFFDSLYQKEPLFGRESFVSDDVILEFVEIYRQECARINGNEYLEQEINSPQRILREIKYFLLNYSAIMLFFATALWCQNPTFEPSIQMLIGTHKRLILFKKLKKRFIDEGIFTEFSLEEAFKDCFI